MSTEAEQCHGSGGGGADDDGDGGLPEDQMFELLTRVSLDDLAACRQVSNQWRRLTYEPAFGPLHCRRHTDAVVSGYFIQGMARNRYSATFVSMMTYPSSPTVSLDFLPCAHVRVEAVSAHRGLACCVDADADAAARMGGKASSARCYYACKPATKQWLALPNPRLRFPTAATAMVARPASAGAAADFKILRLSVATLRDRLRCEIFDSRRGAWRRSAEVMVWPESLVAAGPATRVHGAMHWLRWPDRLTGAEDIFAFDMKSETWRLIGLPPEVEDKAERWARKKLVMVEGKLCLLVMVEEEAELWVIASYGMQQERWEKKMVVRLKSLAVQEGRELVLRDLCSSEVAFFNTVYRVIWYDFWKGKVAEVPVHHKCIQEVFKYESDLVPWDIDDENKI